MFKELDNVYIAQADFDSMLGLAPRLKRLFEQHSGKHYLVQLGDILRLVLLHRYGGTYMDSDVVSRQKVPDDTATNFFVEGTVYNSKLR